MKNNRPTYGGTRPASDEVSSKQVDPPPVIDPAQAGNAPMPCEPHADPKLFDGDLMAALRHKHRPFHDALGRQWVSNIHGDPDNASTVLLAATQGLVVGQPRPTTSETEGTADKLRKAGIVGLYHPLESERAAVYKIASQGI